MLLFLLLFAFFFVGCENEKGEEAIPIIKSQSLTTKKIETGYSPENYYSLTIQFTCCYAVKDLVINVPIYTYQTVETSVYNKLEREIAEIPVGTTVKNGTYRMTYQLKHQTAWGSFNSISISIGKITVKSGEIIE